MLEKRPGMISDKLREALGMTPNSPPPWLYNMQRVGMPPSYQTLRIPGMNAPRPPGTEFGYHPGGWGQPPLDEYGNALFPEAFSEPVEVETLEFRILEGPHWGTIAKEVYEESSSEEVEEEEESSEEEEAGETTLLTNLEIVQPEEDLGGIETPITGMETPTNIEATLRKRKNKDLYSVLEQKDSNVSSGELYGSSHLYVLPAAKNLQLSEEVELSLDPSEIPNLTEDALAKKFDKELAQKQKEAGVLADEGKKRKRTTSTSAQPPKKKKKEEFKF